jgi:ribose 5-phosphate isomerase B
MKIYLGADHRGFELKKELKDILDTMNVSYEDLGNLQYDKDDDYPDFAQKVAERVTKEEDTRGIVICGSGAGVDIAANKVKGARSTLALSPDQVEHARANDDINVLAIAADFVAKDTIQQLLKAFVTTHYTGEERHDRRLQKIAAIENNGN